MGAVALVRALLSSGHAQEIIANTVAVNREGSERSNPAPCNLSKLHSAERGTCPHLHHLPELGDLRVLNFGVASQYTKEGFRMGRCGSDQTRIDELQQIEPVPRLVVLPFLCRLGRVTQRLKHSLLIDQFNGLLAWQRIPEKTLSVVG